MPLGLLRKAVQAQYHNTLGPGLQSSSKKQQKIAAVRNLLSTLDKYYRVAAMM